MSLFFSLATLAALTFPSLVCGWNEWQYKTLGWDIIPKDQGEALRQTANRFQWNFNWLDIFKAEGGTAANPAKNLYVGRCE